jgi:hypothetical protein
MVDLILCDTIIVHDYYIHNLHVQFTAEALFVPYINSQVSTAVSIHSAFISVITLCSVAGGY